MKNRKTATLLLSLLSLAAILFLIACPTTDEPNHVLNMKIDKDNDSLLTFDSLIVKVYSKDSAFSEIVFHGKLTDPKQVLGLQLDPRVGKEFKVSIIGYKGGKVGVNKEITILANNTIQSKNLPVQTGKDTTLIDPTIPEIIAPSDTSVAEGDSLRFRVSIRNPLSGATTLTLKITIPGAVFNTIGPNPIDGYFTWRPSLTQGQINPYSVTFVYASADRKVERTISVKVLNTNQAPKLKVISDQKIDEDATLTFKVEATDPDADSLTLTAAGLPAGATFSSGTFSWKPTVGQAGNYSVKFKVSDGRDSDLVATLVTVGNVAVPPALTVKITSPIHDTTVNFTPITILYTVNGTPLQKKFPLKDGKNKIFIDTTVAGRIALDTITITLDTIPPNKPAVTGATPVRTRTPTWTWASGGNGTGTYRYRLDIEDMTASILSTELTYMSSKELDPGSHTLFVQERDAAGNWSQSGKRSIFIDTTRPAPPTVTTNPASPTNDNRPTWNWHGTGDDIAEIYRYQLDKPDFQGSTMELSVTAYRPEAKDALKEGLHILYVEQRDLAGNWSLPTNAPIMVMLTPPEAPKVTATQTSPTNNVRPNWAWTSGSGGTKQYRYKLNDSILTLGSTNTTQNTFTPDTALREGKNILYVQERDSAGNWSVSGYSALTIDITPPPPPVFTSALRSPLNTLQPKWTWQSGGGGAGYRCKLNDSTWSKDVDTVTIGEFNRSLAEGRYTLYVQERDGAGNWSRSATQTTLLTLRGPLGAENFSAGAADYTTMALYGDLPYIAYQDAANGNKISVMRYDGTKWSPVGTAGFSDGDATFISLAISSTGTPYVAYADGANFNKPTVKRFNAGAWESVGPAAAGGSVIYLSLRLNGSIPYLAYRDDAIGSKATVVKFNGSIWEPVGTAGFSPLFISSASMVLDKNAVPYVVYATTDSTPMLSVRKFSGTAWIPVGPSRFGPSTEAYQPTFAMDGNNVPYVAYSNGDNNFTAEVLKFDGSNWNNVVKPASALGRSLNVSLALGPDGTPYLAMQDAQRDNKLTVVRLNGGTWETIGVPGFTSGQVGMLTMTVTTTGIPYVGFVDAVNGHKVTVLKVSFDP